MIRFIYTTITLFVFTYSIFANQLENFPELQQDKVGNENIQYYFKYQIGEDRTAYINDELKLIVLNPEFGKVFTLSHYPCRVDTSSEKEQSIVNTKVKLTDKSIFIEFDIFDYYYHGRGEVKEKSSDKEIVGKGDFLLTFKKNLIKYEIKILPGKEHAVRSYFSYFIPGIVKTEEEKNTHVFKKNRRKTTATLVPIRGKPITYNVYDKESTYLKKMTVYEKYKEAGWRELTFRERLGCKEISFKNTSKYTNFSIDNGYNFSAYGSQRIRNLIDIEGHPYYVDFKYKTQSSSRSKKLLKKGRLFKHSGYIVVK